MIWLRVPVLVVAVVAQGALAQTMYKCQNSAGKVEYSNRPCSTGPELKRIAPDVAPTVDRSRKAHDQQPPSVGANEVVSPRTPIEAMGGSCYVESDLREIDVPIASPSLPTDTREFLLQERSRIMSCKLGRLSGVDRQTRVNELRRLSSTDKQSRQVARNTIEGIYAKYASETERSTAALEKNTAAIDNAAKSSRTIIINGKPYIPAKGGVVDAVTGKFCPQSGNTYFCP